MGEDQKLFILIIGGTGKAGRHTPFMIKFIL